MNNTVKKMMVGAMAAGLLAAPAVAGGVSFGLSVGNGGTAVSLGVNAGGHGYDGHGGYVGRGGPVHRQMHRPPAHIGVVIAPAPVVVAPAGYWQEREERVWVDGVWIETADAWGRRVRQWQPGRWEIRRTREWIGY
jgi:hypothetical protein